MRNRKIAYALTAVCVWILIWQLLAMKIDKTIFLPTPLEVCEALKKMAFTTMFYKSIVYSLWNIVKGFTFAVLAGIILAVIASRSLFLKSLFNLPIKVIRAIPVASFTILALFWLESSDLSVLISFFMVLPIMYTNVLAGIEHIDKELLEVSKVFRFKFGTTCRFVYVPEILPYFVSAVSVGTGLAWKSGIAAEVIGIVGDSIGNNLYQSKLYLEMPELFAWTIVIICISAVFERINLLVISFMEWMLLRSKYMTLKPGAKRILAEENKEVLSLKGIFKNYGDHKICEDFDMELTDGTAVALMGHSGIGKTTIARIMLGLERPDKGFVTTVNKVAVVFQEDRVFKQFSVAANLAMVCSEYEQIHRISEVLRALGLEGTENRKVDELSGGMKRRVAIARALIAEAEMLILDEPLKGLDEDTKLSVMKYIKECFTDKKVSNLF